jgi:GNAT superfamily N-acetyltransferase
MIRPARPDELLRLAEIEDAAAEMFRGTAMDFIFRTPPAPPATAIPEGVLILVSVDLDDRAMGFLEAEPMGGWLHILELSVHPDGQRQGRAKALLDHAAGMALAAGLSALSLTTDAELPWNGPMYQRLGFARLAPVETPDWLSALLAREAGHGFDPARRIAMMRST